MSSIFSRSEAGTPFQFKGFAIRAAVVVGAAGIVTFGVVSNTASHSPSKPKNVVTIDSSSSPKPEAPKVEAPKVQTPAETAAKPATNDDRSTKVPDGEAGSTSHVDSAGGMFSDPKRDLPMGTSDPKNLPTASTTVPQRPTH